MALPFANGYLNPRVDKMEQCSDWSCRPLREAQLEYAALDAYGAIDILVNNAGFQRESPSEALDVETYRRIIDVNLNGAVLCAQKALAHFVARGGGGSIIPLGELCAETSSQGK